jgi:hypothetical protein
LSGKPSKKFNVPKRVLTVFGHAIPEGMRVVIAYSAGGADVTDIMEDVVAGTVEEEAVGVERLNNSKMPIPAATATTPAPAYFRKRRLEEFRLDLLDSTKALNPLMFCLCFVWP